jgi:microcystin-dependent protein
MCERYDSDPHLAYFTFGTGCGDAEAFITKGSNGLPQLNALGGVAIWEIATIHTTSFYGKACQFTPFIFITGDPVPGDVTTIPDLLSRLTNSYGPRFGFKSSGLDAEKIPNPVFAQYYLTNPLGFQFSGLHTIGAVTAEILANGYLLGGTVPALGGQFFELYINEVIDPIAQPIFRVYATLLFPPPVPIPIDLTMAAAPLGWRGSIADFLILFAASLSAELSPTFLIGETDVRNNIPTHDIGPWFDGYGWWFFDPLSGAYQPSDQGCAIGTIAMWGGGYTPPRNWLRCDASQVDRGQYSRLFQAVGETWGAGDGKTTFNLPPYGVIFVNAAGFVASSTVPLTPQTQPDGTITTNGQGVGARGGGELSRNLLASDVPKLLAHLYVDFNFLEYTLFPQTNLPNMGAGALGSSPQMDFPVLGLDDTVTGKDQVPISIMPPFVTINYIIKYQ